MRIFHGLSFAIVWLLFFCLSATAQIYHTISTYAGPPLPVTGDDARSRSIGVSASVVPDGLGGVYVASAEQNRVYRIDANGLLTVVAGTGSLGSSGDGGPAILAGLNPLRRIALDPAGNLFILEVNKLAHADRIRKVAPNGIITTVAGSADGPLLRIGMQPVPATSVSMNVDDFAVDGAGNIFIFDFDSLRKVGSDGILTTLVRSVPGPGFGVSLALGPDGTIFMSYDARVVKFNTDFRTSPVAGTGNNGFSGDGGPATSADLSNNLKIAVDQAGNLYIADGGTYRVRKVSPQGIITTIAGTGTAGFSGDGGPATAALLGQPNTVAADSSGSVFVGELLNARIRRITPDGLIDTLAGIETRGFAGDGGPALSALLNNPTAVTVDRAGNLYIADSSNSRVRKVTPDGIITTIAGNGTFGFSGDGGPATAAAINFPHGLAVDSAGNVFIADTGNGRVREVTTDGFITTVAGGGASVADGIAGAEFRLSGPWSLVFDPAGNLFIGEQENRGFAGHVRKLSPDGVMTSLPGTYTGMAGLTMDAVGNLFISTGHEVLKVRPDGSVENIGAFATIPGVYRLLGPSGLVVDTMGDLYVSDTGNGRIQKLRTDHSTGWFAGSGPDPFQRIAGFSGDGGLASLATFNGLDGLAFDAAGNLYVADSGNNRIRKISPVASQVISSISRNTGWSLQTSGGTQGTVTGYASILSNSNGQAPAGLAIFGLRQNGILVTEASVPASPAIQRGRTFAEVHSTVNTGLAIANPNDQPVTVSFFFTDAGGDSSKGALTVPGNGQLSAFLDQSPFNGPSSFTGTFTFSSTLPIAAIALRGVVNERGEFLLTTLPVADLGTPTVSATIVFPDFADGAGWTSQIVLLNPGDSVLSGTVQLLDQAGQPVIVDIDGQAKSSLSYSLAPRNFQRFKTGGLSSSVIVGSVRVNPGLGSASPSGLLIFSFRNAGITVTEASVPAIPSGIGFRLYSEMSQNFGVAAPGSVQSGIAIANISAASTLVTLELRTLNGIAAAPATTITIPAGGQKAVFLNQIPGFASVQTPFRGVLRVTSSTPIAVMGLRERYNERSDFLITTVPAVSEAATPTAPLYFPHIVDSGGFTTQFILFSSVPNQLSGSLRFFSPSGQPLNLNLH